MLTRYITKHPVWVLLAGGLITLVAAVYGLSVFDRLSNGGYGDPQSSSQLALDTINDQFKDQRSDIVILFTTETDLTNTPAYATKIQQDLANVGETEGVAKVTSYYSTQSPTFISKGGRQTFALVAVEGSEPEQTKTFHIIRGKLADAEGVTIEFGGNVVINDQISEQINRDLEKAEILSFPILAVLLMIIFRSVVAALVPLVLGGLSILVAFLLIRLLTNYADVSVFAINIITLMGLGLAIDYSLFIVSRFREELARGASVKLALATTMQTAGRTVFFSACTVILCLLGLLVFPQGFLRSMGLGGAASVAATALLALTVLPAALRLLGRRINAWALPGLTKRHTRPAEQGIWYRYSHFIMRRPLLTLAISLEVLVILGLPFLSARFSTPDAKTVPPGLSSRQVNDQLEQNFAGAGDSSIALVVKADGSASSPENRQRLGNYLSALDSIDGVWSTQVTAESGSYYYVRLIEAYPSQSRSAQQTVREVRAVDLPGGWSANSGGTSAELVDLLDGLKAKLPLAALVIVASTSLLLFLMLGSVIVPIKAVILNVLSLSAAFGLLVWIFQDGHLTNQLGLIANGTIDATQPVLIFAIAFGLAMDYELFLLSRIKEEYDKSGDNAHSVALGVEKTAGIITSAALMLVVVIGLFATGKIGIIQQVGLGLAAAVAIDATIVRMILVPSAMQLLGKTNWWAPAPLAKLVRRLGLAEKSA